MASVYIMRIADALEEDWDKGFADFLSSAVKELGGSRDLWDMEMTMRVLSRDLEGLIDECDRRGLHWGDVPF